MDKLKSYKLYDIVLSSTLTNFIPDGLTGILYRHYPSGRTSALGSIRSTTEMSTRSILGSNGGRCVGLRTFMCRLSRNSGSLKLLEPSRSVQPCIGVALPFTLTNTFWILHRGYVSMIYYRNCHCREMQQYLGNLKWLPKVPLDSSIESTLKHTRAFINIQII